MYNYWVLFQIQKCDGTTALTAYGITFENDPPALKDLIDLQNKMIEDSRFNDPISACIILNFKKLS